MPYHPCLFFVKVEVGRKKKAEDVSDVKFLLFEADGVDACNVLAFGCRKKRSRSVPMTTSVVMADGKWARGKKKSYCQTEERRDGGLF